MEAFQLQRIEALVDRLAPYTSEPAQASMRRALLTVSSGGAVDIVARVDGRDHRFEADWLKYLPEALSK